MIGLIRSETLRLLSRRLLRVLTLLALVGIVVSVIIVGAKSHHPSPEEQTAFQQELQQQIDICASGGYFPRSSVPPGMTMRSYCTQVISSQSVPSGEYSLSGLADTMRGTAVILLVLGLVIGASAAGADWQSGSMATLLAWEPRRIRVLLARTVVVGVTLFVLAILLQAALAGLLALVANTRGSTIGTGGDFTHAVIGVILRVGVMTTILALVGVAISTVGRTTAASLGVVFVYLALVESLLHALIPRITPWLLSVNTVVFVDGRAQDVGDSHPVHLTPAHSTGVVIAYAVILLAAAAAFFRTRDVS